MKHAASGASRPFAVRREPGRRRAGKRRVSGGGFGQDGVAGQTAGLAQAAEGGTVPGPVQTPDLAARGIPPAAARPPAPFAATPGVAPTVPLRPVPAGPVPAGAIPAGPVPTGPVPAGAIPAGPVPAGPIPAGPIPVRPVPPAPAAGAWPPPAAAPRTRLAQLPYALVLAGAAGGVVVIRLGTQYVKSGTLVLAGVLLLAALARLVLPDRRAGLLSSRRRLLDVVIFAALGLGLLAAGWLVLVPA